jgi:hypothetical protein
MKIYKFDKLLSEAMPKDDKFSGNCGMYAIALAKCALDNNKKPVIVISTDTSDLDELMHGDPKIYHVATEIDGILYDGSGQIEEDMLSKYAYNIYGDAHPKILFLEFNNDVIKMIRQQTNWDVLWQEYYKEINKNIKENYEYLGTCITTVDDSCIWDATEMAQLIDNSRPFDIDGIYTFLSNELKNKVKNNPSEVECGINNDIVFVYDIQDDIHYFYKKI